MTTKGVEFQWNGRPADVSKMHADALEVLGEGLVEAGSWLLSEIEGTGAAGRIAPVYWPYLTGFSRNSFYLDNQEVGPEVKWELHNSATAPVGSNNYYAVWVERKYGVIADFAQKSERKMLNIIGKHIADWFD